MNKRKTTPWQKEQSRLTQNLVNALKAYKKFHDQPTTSAKSIRNPNRAQTRDRI